MILVIDTSSARSAVALLGPRGDVVAEELADSGRTFSVPARVMAITAGQTIKTVMVATGPGSFTGLRSGVSFGLGLAIGLRIPICPLSTLALQAARSDTPVTALAEAGRGRVYRLPPGGEPAVGEASDVDGDLPAVGWLRPSTEAALRAAGVTLLDPAQLRTLGAAAATLLGSAREVAYGSLKLEYMYGFSAPSRQG